MNEFTLIKNIFIVTMIVFFFISTIKSGSNNTGDTKTTNNTNTADNTNSTENTNSTDGSVNTKPDDQKNNIDDFGKYSKTLFIISMIKLQ